MGTHSTTTFELGVKERIKRGGVNCFVGGRLVDKYNKGPTKGERRR
jgi:hypothetical protein